MIFRVGLTFAVDDGQPPPRAVIHDALEALRAVEVEAPTQEAAEHFVDRIRLVLEQAGN